MILLYQEHGEGHRALRRQCNDGRDRGVGGPLQGRDGWEDLCGFEEVDTSHVCMAHVEECAKDDAM